MFIEAQGYEMKENIIYYQDNMSAMKLEKNGMRENLGTLLTSDFSLPRMIELKPKPQNKC
jgi:hypothetical protein